MTLRELKSAVNSLPENVLDFEFTLSRSKKEVKPVIPFSYEYEVQGMYAGYWERIVTEPDYKSAKETLRVYNQEEREYPHRIHRIKESYTVSHNP